MAPQKAEAPKGPLPFLHLVATEDAGAQQVMKERGDELPHLCPREPQPQLTSSRVFPS